MKNILSRVASVATVAVLALGLTASVAAPASAQPGATKVSEPTAQLTLTSEIVTSAIAQPGAEKVSQTTGQLTLPCDAMGPCTPK